MISFRSYSGPAPSGAPSPAPPPTRPLAHALVPQPRLRAAACSAGRGRRGQPRGSGPAALGRPPRSPSDSAPAVSGRPARDRRRSIGLSAPDQLLGSRGRTEAASSAAGCGADPGDEMTTPTLQVPRRGPARLTEAEGARRGLRASWRPPPSHGLAPPPCRSVPVSLFSRSEPWVASRLECPAR